MCRSLWVCGGEGGAWAKESKYQAYGGSGEGLYQRGNECLCSPGQKHRINAETVVKFERNQDSVEGLGTEI